MPDDTAQRMMMALNERCLLALRGRWILLLGRSYKKNTGDIRESPSTVVAGRLVAMGAHVKTADPFIGGDDSPDGVSLVEVDRAELTGADAVVLLVDHDAFDLDAIVAASSYVPDTRNCLPAAPHVERL